MGAVHLIMQCCHNLLTTKHHYVTTIFIILTMALATGQGARIKREAGFYTTRYGRSDPMLKFPGVHTNFLTQGNLHQADWRAGGDIGLDGVDDGYLVDHKQVAPLLLCAYSPRGGQYQCYAVTPGEWQKTAQALGP